jgi:hypothetical protein
MRQCGVVSVFVFKQLLVEGLREASNNGNNLQRNMMMCLSVSRSVLGWARKML